MDTLSRTYTLTTALRIDFEALGDGAAHRIAAAFQEAQLDATAKVTSRKPRVQVTGFELEEHKRVLRFVAGGDDSARRWWHVMEPYLDSAVGGAVVYYGATQSSLAGICAGSVILCRSVAAWVRRDA